MVDHCLLALLPQCATVASPRSVPLRRCAQSVAQSRFSAPHLSRRSQARRTLMMVLIVLALSRRQPPPMPPVRRRPRRKHCCISPAVVSHPLIRIRPQSVLPSAAAHHKLSIRNHDIIHFLRFSQRFLAPHLSRQHFLRRHSVAFQRSGEQFHAALVALPEMAQFQHSSKLSERSIMQLAFVRRRQ